MYNLVKIKSLNTHLQRNIGGKKRIPFPKDAQKYNLVVVGGNIGAIVSRHIDHISKGKHSIFVCFENGINEYSVSRALYEQGRHFNIQYLPTTKLSVSSYNPTSDNIPVEIIQPQKNSLTLRNGRKIEYDTLVMACGQQLLHKQIQGFDDAWSDINSKFFVPKLHQTWKSYNSKINSFNMNFNGGECIFYIPRFPFIGEIQLYNWFICHNLWSWYDAHGKLSWENSKITIINANDTFAKYSKSTDQFIKRQAQRRKIPIEYGLNLVKIDKVTNQATFQKPDGSKVVRKYEQMNSLIPTGANPLIAKSGLSADNGYLDVDIHSLQHKKYSNIFGLGSCINVPTTKGHAAHLYQAQVIRHNVFRNFNGLKPNASYKGTTECPLFLGHKKLTHVKHDYEKDLSGHLFGAENFFLSSLNYFILLKLDKKKWLEIAMFKNWGPPYYKIKQRFSDGDGKDAAAPVPSIEPAKKEA